MRFVVVGAGAIGALVGGRLHQAGEDVVLVARGEHLEALRRDGLRLEDPEETVTLSVPSAGHPREVDWDDGDVVLLAVKSQDTDDALAGVPDGDVPVFCLQNGVENERRAARRFAQVYGVCVMCPATHLEPGVVEANSTPHTGILDLGRYPAGTDDLAAAVASAFSSATFVSEPRPDVMRWKYGKLLMNLGNAVEALCGHQARMGDLAALARQEGLAVLRAAGIDFVDREEDEARRRDLLRMRPVGGRRREGGSTWQSLRRGTPAVETDHLNGEIVLLGRLHGVPTPVNELLQRRMADAAASGLVPGSVDPEDLLAEMASAPGPARAAENSLRSAKTQHH